MLDASPPAFVRCLTVTAWIATLPMYNVTPALDALWRALLRDTLRAFEAACGPVAVELPGQPPDDLAALWRRPDLLLSQTCGYPLTHGLAEQVRLVATPVFDAHGCEGPGYRSAIVVAKALGARGIDTLAACGGLRAVFNTDDSNSGMNVFRHAAARYARNGRFFGAVRRTGSHLASLTALARGEADVAAIDCVTLAFVRDALPELAACVDVIDMTVGTPALPFVAARQVSCTQLQALRDALETARAADPVRAQRLRLTGLALLDLQDYRSIPELEDEAVACGYPELA